MKNLFNSIYIKSDYSLYGSQNHKRIVITSKKLDFTFSTDPSVLKQIGVIGVFNNLQEVYKTYNDSESFWTNLLATKEKICIVSDQETTCRLLIQYWKSLIPKLSVDVAYTLLRMYNAYEKLLSYKQNDIVSFRTDVNTTDTIYETLDKSFFESIFKEENRCAILTESFSRNRKLVPVEYLMASYFTNTLDHDDLIIFLKKFRDISLENAILQLCSARDDILTETQNHYQLGEFDFDNIDIYNSIKNHPDLSWVFDECFINRDVKSILSQYKLRDLKRFFETYTKLLRYKYDEETALDYIINNDIMGLVEYDVSDEKGNFLSSESFASKVNGVFVSYMYSLKNQKKTHELLNYNINDV